MNIDFYDGLGLDEKIQNLIRRSIRVTSEESASVTDVQEVGIEFEPRIKVMYDLYHGGIPFGRYEHTLILDRAQTEIVNIIDKNKID